MIEYIIYGMIFLVSLVGMGYVFSKFSDPKYKWCADGI